MRLIAISAVMSGRSEMNSVVMIEPALSSGYLSSSLICLRMSLSAVRKIRLTTLAGISSIRSTASSKNSSSTTSLSSLSEKPWIKNACVSSSISTKVSAASSLGKSLNKMGIFSSCNSSNTAAMS